MIPAGYVNSIVVWAKRPDLTADEKVIRRDHLLELHDALVTGQLTPKAGGTITEGNLNGQAFTLLPDLTASEKLTVITAVITELGAAPAPKPAISYGNFSGIQR
jgi:hypothetical protein